MTDLKPIMPVLTPELEGVLRRLQNAEPTPAETIAVSCDDASALMQAITEQAEVIAARDASIADLRRELAAMLLSLDMTCGQESPLPALAKDCVRGFFLGGKTARAVLGASSAQEAPHA